MKAEWQPIETIPKNQTVFVYDEVEGIYLAKLTLVRMDKGQPPHHETDSLVLVSRFPKARR